MGHSQDITDNLMLKIIIEINEMFISSCRKYRDKEKIRGSDDKRVMGLIPVRDSDFSLCHACDKMNFRNARLSSIIELFMYET